MDYFIKKKLIINKLALRKHMKITEYCTFLGTYGVLCVEFVVIKSIGVFIDDNNTGNVAVSNLDEECKALMKNVRQ